MSKKTGRPKSPTTQQAENVPFGDYWRLRMDGAISRLKAVQAIVKHKLSRGTLAESLLREVIAEFLPQRYAAATGFIMDDAQASKQIDIIVYDQLANSAVFRDGGFVVLTPDIAQSPAPGFAQASNALQDSSAARTLGVKLVIEVKSDLKGATDENNEMKIAFDNIRLAKQIDPKVRGFIFSYSGNTIDTFVQHTQKWMDRVPRPEWPDGVYNLEREFMMIPTPGGKPTHSIYENKTIIRSFLTEALMTIGLANVRGFFSVKVDAAADIGKPKEMF